MISHSEEGLGEVGLVIARCEVKPALDFDVQVLARVCDEFLKPPEGTR
jgi:hypothetical protein